jgi:hypothetical protein
LWVIAVVAGVIALGCFLLWVPLDLALNTEINEKPKVRLKFSWFYGLVSREIPRQKVRPTGQKPVSKKKKKSRFVNYRVFFSVIRTKGLFRQLRNFIKDLLSCFRFRDMAADFTIGLGDPADTGLLFAIAAPATALYGLSDEHRIRIRPSFSDDAVLQGYSRGTIRLRPIRLVPPFLKLVFSLPAARATWKLIGSKWREKN